MMNIKKIIIQTLGLLLLSPILLAKQSPIEGRWKTIDDETKKPKSVVEITQVDGTYVGHIKELIEPKEPNPLCDKCQGEKKDKPIIGLEFLWGLKESEPGAEWDSGKILDPKNGKTYKCKAKLVENGTKLEVRGYIGFSLIGRTQVWEKAD
jgi:uncharacterized protein (DUF2147 family)